jgi:hypothetical protein
MRRTLKRPAAIDDVAPERREPACWRAVRISDAQCRRVGRANADIAPGLSCSPDLSRSPALSRWLGLLASRPLPAGYRISRV